MPQAASITINDRAASPVAHIYAPRSIASGVTTYVETASVPIGESKLTISSRKTGTKYKVRVVLSKPTLVNETINGVVVPRVPRTAFAELNLTFDETSSLQERKDTVGLLANAMAASQTQVDLVLTALESIY